MGDITMIKNSYRGHQTHRRAMGGELLKPHQDASGHDVKQLGRAGVFRMRPILMTSILALTPLALRIGAGSAMQSPLAISIIAGLILAVPLVLLVLPAVYLSLQRLRAHLFYAYE